MSVLFNLKKATIKAEKINKFLPTEKKEKLYSRLK